LQAESNLDLLLSSTGQLAFRHRKPRVVLLFGNTAGSIENSAAPGLATTGEGGYLAAKRVFSRGSSGLCLLNSSKTGTYSAPEASY